MSQEEPELWGLTGRELGASCEIFRMDFKFSGLSSFTGNMKMVILPVLGGALLVVTETQFTPDVTKIRGHLPVRVSEVQQRLRVKLDLFVGLSVSLCFCVRVCIFYTHTPPHACMHTSPPPPSSLLVGLILRQAFPLQQQAHPPSSSDWLSSNHVPSPEPITEAHVGGS